MRKADITSYYRNQRGYETLKTLDKTIKETNDTFDKLENEINERKALHAVAHEKDP